MGGLHSKDGEHRTQTGSPDPVIPKKNDAKSHAGAPMEQVQTNKSSTAVATSPSAETSEAAVHEEPQAHDKGQLNKAQTELHKPDCKSAFPQPPVGTDQFPNVAGPDTSRRQDKDPNNNNNNDDDDGVFPPGQHNFYQTAEHGRDHDVYHDYPGARRDSSSNRRFDHYYPYPRDQEFCPVPPRAHYDQYQGQDQYWHRNDHSNGRRYPQTHGDGREYPAADTNGIQSKERRSYLPGDGDELPRAPTNDEQSGTLVFDNIVICEDPSKVVIGKRNTAGGKVGGRISGNRVVR